MKIPPRPSRRGIGKGLSEWPGIVPAWRLRGTRRSLARRHLRRAPYRPGIRDRGQRGKSAYSRSVGDGVAPFSRHGDLRCEVAENFGIPAGGTLHSSVVNDLAERRNSAPPAQQKLYVASSCAGAQMHAGRPRAQFDIERKHFRRLARSSHTAGTGAGDRRAGTCVVEKQNLVAESAARG